MADVTEPNLVHDTATHVDAQEQTAGSEEDVQHITHQDDHHKHVTIDDDVMVYSVNEAGDTVKDVVHVSDETSSTEYAKTNGRGLQRTTRCHNFKFCDTEPKETTETIPVINFKHNCNEKSFLHGLFYPRDWFTPEKLNPQVADLIFWKRFIKSALIFSGGLILLLILHYFPPIIIFAYLSLSVLSSTFTVRVYNCFLGILRKDERADPFKQLLNADLSLSKDKADKVEKLLLMEVNKNIAELKRLLLVEDVFDSIIYALFCWCLTHLGMWFSGTTLSIIIWITVFTIPKVYKVNETRARVILHMVKEKFQICTQISRRKTNRKEKDD